MKSFQIFYGHSIKLSPIKLLNVVPVNIVVGTLKTIFIVTLLFCSTPLIAGESQNEDKTYQTSEDVKIERARGTGQTTGHIAILSITNTSDSPILLKSQTMFIPSRNDKYQSYVGRILPGQSVPPGQTISVLVIGFCTDVHKPPVPEGTDLPSIDRWIPVRDPSIPKGTSPEGIVIIPGKEQEPFTPEDIPKIIALPGYTKKEQKPDGDPFIITWPGTDSLVYGTFTISKNEKEIAPLIVDVVIRIEKTTIEMIGDSLINTPFSADEKREKETVIQQTIWRYMAEFTGEKYGEDDFLERIIAQYEENTETKIEDAPAETVEKLEKGVDDFWGAFELVGAKAKVFSTQNIASIDYDSIKKKEDFDNWRRKKYDDYAVERALNGKNHKKACKAIGVDPDSDFGKALARAYANDK